VTRRRIEPRRVDLSSVARSVLANLRSAAPERRVELVVQAEISAELDPKLLRP